MFVNSNLFFHLIFFTAFSSMGKGKRLNEKEKGKIEILASQDVTMTAIADQIGRSRGVVTSFTKNPELYGTFKHLGRPKKLSQRVRRRICELASNKSISAAQIKDELKLDVSVRTISRILRSSENLTYKKMLCKPPLTPAHKKARWDFGNEHMERGQKWFDIIWSDEKKFNLDGPDGWSYYWHDLRKEERIFSRRIQGGGSVMIWGAFCGTRKLEIKIIDNKMNADKYISLLSQNLKPLYNLSDRDLIFQQDNAPCHSANKTHDWLETNGISTMNWPARSPDLNPIENLWGILARKVYANGKQFKDEDELIGAILKSWNEITQEELENLVKSMGNRIRAVIAGHGANTKY